VTLADAWAVERREFHVMHGYDDWKMYHPGQHPANTADEGTPLMWPDIEELAAASLARITSPGTSFVLTAAGVRYAKRLRQGTDAARAEGVGRVGTLTKTAAPSLGHTVTPTGNASLPHHSHHRSQLPLL